MSLIKTTMTKKHIYVSIRTPVQEYSVLLYTIVPHGQLQPFYEILEKGLLQPLRKDRVVHLGTTYQSLQALFSKSAWVDYATHWFASTKDRQMNIEQVIRNMVDPHLSFMMVDHHVIREVHMNEEGAMERFHELLL